MAEPRLLFSPAASVLITGASSGIGAGLAAHIAEYGAKIALFARRRERLEEVAEKVAAAGAKPLVLAGDVTDPASVAEAHERLVREQGPADVAFLNAGVGDYMRAGRFEAARVKRVFEVNVFGVAHWLEPLLATMLERRSGRIVGISSLAAHLGVPSTGAYGASKAALSLLLESLRVEVARQGVQITTVEPGFVRSELTDKNKHPMPFLMDAPAAARAICDGVAENKRVLRFPWQMSAAIRVLGGLPTPLYDRIARTMMPKGKRR